MLPPIKTLETLQQEAKEKRAQAIVERAERLFIAFIMSPTVSTGLSLDGIILETMRLSEVFEDRKDLTQWKRG